MSDRFVTIASYAWTPEAELAKNLLEAEGIAVILGGDFTANALTGMMGEAQLQVREQDAARAVGLLASVAARATVDDDWETQAERAQSVCSLCGVALQPGESTCPACGTANEHITAHRPGSRSGPIRRAKPGPVKTSDQVQAEVPRRPAASGAGEDADSVPAARSGCAVLLLGLLLVPLWLLLG